MKSGEKSKHPPLAEKSKNGDEKFHLIGMRKIGVKSCTCEGDQGALFGVATL
jgi:hypothetical protein